LDGALAALGSKFQSKCSGRAGKNVIDGAEVNVKFPTSESSVWRVRRDLHKRGLDAQNRGGRNIERAWFVVFLTRHIRQTIGGWIALQGGWKEVCYVGWLSISSICNRFM